MQLLDILKDSGVEMKKSKMKDGKEQLKSYCNATGAPIVVWTNGNSISFYHRRDSNYFEDIPLVEQEIQQQIAELIKKSFYLCRESERLLEEAKDMVEKEIEKGVLKYK
jgi:type I restriction enzyme M protein